MAISIRTRVFALLGCLLASQFLGTPELGACDPDAWYGHRDIVVLAGTVAGPIDAGNGSDSILVEADAQVLAEGQEATGIDGGNGKDTISNAGSISVSADATLNDFGSVRSQAVGIDGGNGKDTCDLTEASVANEAGGVLDVQAVARASLDDVDVRLVERHEAERSLSVEALATGIQGGNGKDSLANSGDLDVKALAEIDLDTVSISLLEIDSADLSLESKAQAIGFDSGRAKDEVANSGDIAVTATAGIETRGLAISGLAASAPWHSAYDGSLLAQALAVGIRAGSASDTALALDSGSTLSVLAQASIGQLSASLSLVDAFRESDNSLAAQAEAIGVEGGRGGDRLANAGTLQVRAEADIEVWSAVLSAVTLSEGDFDSQASADATGMGGGSGSDQIENSGLVLASADAQAMINGFDFSLVDYTAIPDWFGEESEAAVDAATRVGAQVSGIDSGDCADTIRNLGVIDASAVASGLTIGVEIGAEGLPDEPADLVSLENLADAQVEIKALASGVDSGAGDDSILNFGEITVTAQASQLGAGLSLGLPLISLPYPAPMPAFSSVDAGSDAQAHAVGLDSGQGEDLIVSSGDLTVSAAASALNATASIGFADSVEGTTLALTRVDSLSLASASATGIDSGLGSCHEGAEDTVLNSGAITVNAEAKALGITANVSIQQTVKSAGVVDLQGMLVDASSNAAATALGISVGDGDDLVDNSGGLLIEASGSNAGVGLSAAVVGSSEKGLVLDGALVAADTTAGAIALALDGGTGDDLIHNDGAIEARAEAEALSVGVALSVQGTNTKALSLQAAMASVASRAEAEAAGLSGGSGDDTLINEGALIIGADALSIAAALAVDLMPGKNAGLGLALANATNDSVAKATGLDGGEGDDVIHNSGSIGVDADATAIAASLAVTRQGAAGSLSLDPLSFDAGSLAQAAAEGISGGSGDETIFNEGGILASATAIAPSLGVSIAAKGIAAAITSAEASASATGISGGSGDDDIENSGTIDAEALANADALSVAITGKGLAVSGDDVWDGGVEARALAQGIGLGAGANALSNSGDISTEATAVSVSAGVSVVGTGFAASISTATAAAEATSIEAGETTIALSNTGDLVSEATASAVAVNASVAGKGAAVSLDEVWDGGAEATAQAAGLHAGLVDNRVSNAGTIAAQASATTPSVGVAVAGKGLAVAITASTATAESVALDSSEGDDRVDNSGDLSAGADAQAFAISASIAAQGLAASGDAAWQGGTTASAQALALDSGGGDDTIVSSGDIDASSTATSVAASVQASAQGVGLAVSTSTAEAVASGIAGGEGSDSLTSSGAISAQASSMAITANVAVAGAGVAGAADAVWDGGTHASATATGIDSGADLSGDSIANLGDIDAFADALSVGVSAAISGTGLSLASSTATTEALAAGLSSGSGDDHVANSGGLTIEAAAQGVAVGVSVTGIGVSGSAGAVWDGGAHTNAAASGIQAGEGNDVIENHGLVLAGSEASTLALDFALTIKGVALAANTSTTLAQATGLEGGAGDDTVGNEGAITASADASGLGIAAGLTLFGASGATDAVWSNGTAATSTATAISGGAGDDGIVNSGELTLDARADASAVDLALTGIGLGAALSNTSVEALATGISGGSDDDTIVNSGAIHGGADSLSVGVAVSISGIGLAASGTDLWDNGIWSAARIAGLDSGLGNDDIENSGGLDLRASAQAPAVSVALSGLGVGAALTSATAEAEALGLSGGDGDDRVDNSGAITLLAEADADAVMVAIAGSGFAAGADKIWDGGSTSDAEATGISGGAGKDSLQNSGVVQATARADTASTGVSATLIGASATLVNATALSSARGLDGGGGDDEIRNSGAIGATSYASADTLAVSVAGVGAAVAGQQWSQNAIASASAEGISGGQGKDLIENEASILASSLVESEADSVAVSFLGYANAEARNEALAVAQGLDGGADDDTIRNKGTIEAQAVATTDATGVTVTLAGAAKAVSKSASQAQATGIDAGSGSDSIDNSGALEASAESTTELDSFSFNFAGSSTATGALAATSEALGLSSGEGIDTVRNSGALDVDATASMTIGGSSAVAFGTASTASASTAAAGATGIDSGDDDDTVYNEAAITVNARTNMSLDGSAFSFGGTAGTGQGSMAALSRAVGISGGSGDDTILSKGLIDASAASSLTAASASSVAFGQSSSGSSLDASAEGIGIDGGSGDDTITNLGGIKVGAPEGTGSMSAINLSSSSWTFAGASSGASAGLASGVATGISGGSGVDTILNAALLEALASAGASSSGSSYTFAGSAGARDGIAATTRATGLAGAEGDDTIDNTSSIVVKANANSASNGSADLSFGTADVSSGAVSSASAAGMEGGDGKDSLSNTGSVLADGSATATSVAGTSAFWGTVVANADTEAAAEAFGMAAGDGADTMDNAGTVQAMASAFGMTKASADTDVDTNAAGATTSLQATSTGLSGGAGADEILNHQGASILGKATAQTIAPVDAPNARSDESAIGSAAALVGARGIDAGDAFNAIRNEGTVQAIAKTDLTLSSKASSTSHFAKAHATSDGDGKAYGISSGAGNDVIENGTNGEILANATSLGNASASYIEAHLDEAKATALQDAEAYGIASGGGFDLVVNRGLIDVDAYASSSATASSATWFASNTSTATATAKAWAIGIQEDGSGRIENEGRIEVKAQALSSASASGQNTYATPSSTALAVGIQALSGNTTIVNSGAIVSVAEVSGNGALDAQAYGIRTGGGDDTIYNFGSISTLRIINGAVSGGIPVQRSLFESAAGEGLAADGSLTLKGVGIATGAGNDRVILGDGSSIACTLELGEGDDSLTVIGSGSISGDVFGGEGSDLITLDGATSFSLDRTFDFEGLAKLGSGTVNLGDARWLESLDVVEGVLRIDSGYQFGESGSFRANIYGSGEAGRLEVAGGLGLDGTMTVNKGVGYYRDGSSFLVLRADTLSGTFDTITLPEPTALLSFSLSESGGASLALSASAEPFSSVADSELGRALSACLDAIADEAEGDLSLMLGELQSLDRAAFDDAYASLSPAAYGPSALSTFALMELFGGAHSDRLANLRLLSSGSPGKGAPSAGLRRLSYGGGSSEGGGTARTADDGLWMDSVGRWASFSGEGDVGAFEHSLYGTSLGYDRAFGGTSTGMQVGYAHSDLVQASALGSVDSLGASLYGGTRSGALNLASSIGYAHLIARDERRVEFGSLVEVARSEHAIDALTAYLGAGLELGPRPWLIEPRAALRGSCAWEEGFEEQGAGAASLVVAERASAALLSELGLRLGFALDLQDSFLSADLSALWRHDFGLRADSISAAFTEAPNESFEIAGAPNLGDGVLVEAGLRFLAGKGLSCTIAYGLEVRGAYSASLLSASMDYGF